MSSFVERYEHYRNLVDKNLAQIANKEEPATFYEPVRYVIETKGKRIRPILLMLACEVLGGKIEDCLNAALAVELLHNFTLVHDDIMDDDDLRRGRATVHKKWDQATAILAGDGLVALSYLYLMRTKSDNLKEIGRIFAEGIIEICEGQALDKEFEIAEQITVDQYLKMIEKKTARLLILCAEIGGLIANGNKVQITALKNYARFLGLAFQIQDDLLDLEKTSGKSFASDIRQKKKTLLFVHAYNNASVENKKKLIEIYKKSDIEISDIEKVKSIFEETGTLNFSRDEVKNKIEQAEVSLSALPTNQANSDLRELLQIILNRKS